MIILNIAKKGGIKTVLSAVTQKDTEAPTMLYSTIKPQGIGKPEVESVSSYFQRLALAHCVSPGKLFDLYVVPVLKKHYLETYVTEGGTGFYKASSMLNGVGGAAREFTAALQILTGRKDVHYLTLMQLSPMLTRRGLLKSERAWCPKCYREQAESGRPIYDLLLWAIQSINWCSSHSIPLITECPNCKKTLYALDRNARPGYCPRCNFWLGSYVEQESRPSNIDITYYSWVCKAVGEMLLAMPSMTLDPSVLQQNIRLHLESTGESYAELSRRCGVSKSMVSEWVNGKHLPSLPMLLKLCFNLGCNLMEIMTTGNTQATDHLQIYPSKHEQSSPTIRAKSTKDVNLSASWKAKPQKVKAYPTNMGQSCEYSEELSFILGRPQRVILAKRKAKRLASIAEKIRQTINCLIAQGVYPSVRRVESESKETALMRSNFAKQIRLIEINNYRGVKKC